MNRTLRLAGLCLVMGLALPAAQSPVARAQQASTPTAETSSAELDEALRGDAQLRPRGSQGSAAPLRAQDLKPALEVLRDYRPELADRLDDWAQRNPEEARQMLSRNVPVLARLIKQRREDRPGYKLAIQDMRLYRMTAEVSREYRTVDAKADPGRAKDLSDKLEELLARHFDVRQQIREREVEKLQQRVEQLRKQMEDRNKDREKIIKDRFDQLTSDKGKPVW